MIIVMLNVNQHRHSRVGGYPLPLGEGRLGEFGLMWHCVMGSRLRGNDSKVSISSSEAKPCKYTNS